MKSNLPAGSFNIHWFGLLNAVSFQVMVGAPIILYAKALEASSTVIGIIAAFAPLMVIFQLPAARFLDRFSYRNFILAGWGIRTIFIFIIAFSSLFAFLDAASKMAILLSSLFLYNLLRGITSTAWMPWITALIPEEVRGRFLARDHFFIFSGQMLALSASAFVTVGHTEPWKYAMMFFISGFAAWCSLYFVRKIPDVPSQAVVRTSSVSVPWMAILRYGPFFRLLVFNFVAQNIFTCMAIFSTEFMRVFLGLPNSTILWLTALSVVGAMVALPFCWMMADRVEDFHLIVSGISVFGVAIAVWMLVATGVFPPTLWLLAILAFVDGSAYAVYNLSNVRTIMRTMPEMGRAHFFAMFTVITGLALATVPVGWGLVLDALRPLDLVTGIFVWERYGVFFLVTAVICLLTAASARFLLQEGKSTTGSVSGTPEISMRRLFRRMR